MFWKRIIIVAAIEMAFLIFIIYHGELYEPSMGLVALMWVGIVAGANVIAGLLVLLIDRRMGAILLGSAVIAPFLLMTFTSVAIAIHSGCLYFSHYFCYDGMRYDVMLYKRGEPYATITEVREHSAVGVFQGEYQMRDGVAYMSGIARGDSVRYRLNMNTGQLNDFPSIGQTVRLDQCLP